MGLSPDPEDLFLLQLILYLFLQTISRVVHIFPAFFLLFFLSFFLQPFFIGSALLFDHANAKMNHIFSNNSFAGLIPDVLSINMYLEEPDRR